MKCLILGNSQSPFVYFLSKYLTENYQFEIDVVLRPTDVLHDIPLSENSVENEDSPYREIYKMLAVPLSSFFNLKTILSLRKELKKNRKKYDVCAIHQVDWRYLFIVDLLRKKSKRIVITYWGSDFNLVGRKEKFLQKYLIRNSHFVTVANEAFGEKLKKYFNASLSTKLKIIRFGLEPLNRIKEITATGLECKKALGIQTDLIAVTCGYNAAQNQQHDKIIEALRSIRPEFWDKIVLVFPLTYGGDKDYISTLRQKIEKLPFKSILLTTYLREEEVAHLRKASDIMINIQKEDQFSGSMQEHLYAENIVITGAWLPYRILENNKVFFLKLKAIKYFQMILNDVLDNFKHYKKKTALNREVIWNLYSWDKNIGDWYAVYTGEQL